MKKNNTYCNGSPEYLGQVDTSGKNILSKSDFELFDEEKNIKSKVIEVKRIQSRDKTEKWKIIFDGMQLFVVDGTKLSNKEKEYLRTPNGFNFLAAQGKTGIKSLNKLRIEMKKVLDRKRSRD